METVRDYIEQALESPPIMGIAGVVIGIVFGLIIGWGIAPVKWTDAAVPHLREDLQVEYLRMAVDSYTQNQDKTLAQTRWEQLGEDAPQIMEMLEQAPGTTNVSDITAFNNEITLLASDYGEQQPSDETGQEQAGDTDVDTGGGLGFLKWGLLITIILAGTLVWRYLTRRSTSVDTPAAEAQEYTEGLEATDYSSRGEIPPLHQFTTTYVLGDSLFDDSFGIESAAGEFLGECGVAISESIGVGDPKRVTAFEVWLFDHDDITTITKVLTSSHAYHDESTLTELEKKGEPILAAPNKEFVLETKNLRIIARVMNMVYGEGPLPEESFFERISLELSIWQNNQLDSFDNMDFDEF